MTLTLPRPHHACMCIQDITIINMNNVIIGQQIYSGQKATIDRSSQQGTL